jgi:hypothetical protein
MFSFSPGDIYGRHQRQGTLGFLDHYIYERLRAAENLTFEVMPNKSRSGIDGKLCINRLNMLKGLRFRLNRSTSNSMYISLIRPLMEYGDFIWDGCRVECSNALERIQFDAARLVTGAIKGTNRVALLEELSWDKLETRRYIHKLSVLYKIKNGMVPDYLYVVLPKPVSQISNYPLRNSDDICNFLCASSRFNFNVQSLILSNGYICLEFLI